MLAKNRFLEWAIGDDPAKAGTPQLQWTNLPESWGVFVLLAMIFAIGYGVFLALSQGNQHLLHATETDVWADCDWRSCYC